MANVNLNTPTDYAAEMQALLRRRKLAEMMQQQGMEPDGPTEVVTGWAIPRSPMEGLGKAAKAFSGAYQSSQTDKMQKALIERLRGDQTADYTALAEGIQPRAAHQIAPDPLEADLGGGQYEQPQPMNMPAKPAGVTAGLISQLRLEPSRQAALGMMAKQSEPYSLAPDATRFVGNTPVARGAPRTVAKPAEPEIMRLQTALSLLPEGHPNIPGLKQRIRYLGEGKEPAEGATWGEPYQLGGAWVRKQLTGRDVGKVEQVVTREPRTTIVNPPQAPAPVVQTDKSGNVKFYDRAGNLLKDVGAVGKPSSTFEKQQNAQKQLSLDLTRAISELEKATADDGLIDRSTGSGIGAGVDFLGRLIGKATPGAIAVGEMKPIYDLVLKMVPRFEGPQSEKDTASYEAASGTLANPNVPNEQKKAAGLVILRLMKLRKGQFQSKDIVGTEADTPTPASGWSIKPVP